jgi:hypothetical protein
VAQGKRIAGAINGLRWTCHAPAPMGAGHQFAVADAEQAIADRGGPWPRLALAGGVKRTGEFWPAEFWCLPSWPPHQGAARSLGLRRRIKVHQSTSVPVASESVATTMAMTLCKAVAEAGRGG